MKKLGKKADMWEFRAQVDSVGIKIVEVTMDGNRFFRFRTIFLSWILVDFFVHGVLLLWMCVCCLLSYMTTHRSLQGNG